MGCVSSTLFNRDDDFSQIGGSGVLGHHIVSLTSTTYGLLTLDPPSDHHHHHSTILPPTPPPRFTLGSVFPSSLSEPRSLRFEQPEVINSWELMAGLDTTTDSFRFSPLPLLLPSPTPSKPFSTKDHNNNNSSSSKENSNPNLPVRTVNKSSVFKALKDDVPRSSSVSMDSLDRFEKLCPPNGENRVVIYTTTLRGVRKTFEACNIVRAAIAGLGVLVCERDISMDRGFKEELRELMKDKESTQLVPPRVFVKGRYMGGAEEVMRIVEEGCLGELLEGLPKLKEDIGQTQGKTVVVRCPDCNENGLVLCPICC
ncbi:hypothetical protein F0562_007054 [Nyssa sinensis]|uniref:Glutaredoxin domain-containing protein n=1 Tax=Nyssa sinensis TaxID=561372 RepID=A0A5J5A5H8_9ASTE|nr:hypothetical protein F0562_007054 [Nyssa sinensis]